MLIIIYFTGILILASLNYINMFVITRFDLPTMTEYYRSISNMTRHNGDLNQFFQDHNLFQFCLQLRKSIYFDRTNNANESDVGDFTSSPLSMSTDELEMKRIMAAMENQTLSLHNGISVTLPSFLCMDDERNFETVIAPGIFPSTAILSAVTHAQPDARLVVELKALIDAPAIFKGSRNFNDIMEARSESLMYFIVKSNDNWSSNCNILLNKGGLQRDPLCNLKKWLKYRLCAAASIGLGQINYGYAYHKYYQPENDEKTCRSLLVTDRKSRPYPKMLFCSIKLAYLRVYESFFLSLDVLDTNNVFFFQEYQYGNQFVQEAKHLFVPLLEHLELYEEALKDLDI